MKYQRNINFLSLLLQQKKTPFSSKNITPSKSLNYDSKSTFFDVCHQYISKQKQGDNDDDDDHHHHHHH
ncbi:unnamed protein product [Schistosoma curassoni]|uniref:Ovule protein n=1 Tax=Schistosoma curassoni TaxID=6186 RepID=A0A183K0D6_9TREM|nr:unnamed protein product [Schistosoma curassoni]